jgi:hypothetical protein
LFVCRPELKTVPARPEQVVAIIESINTPMVAAEGRPLEPCQAYIMGVRNPSGLFSIYIYLYQSQSRDCLIYLHEPPEIPMASYQQFELQALNFVESMGFMVDNTNFRSLDTEHRKELIQRLPMFYPSPAAYAQANSQPAATETEVESAEVIELDEEAGQSEVSATVDQEGWQKIIRLLSSF